MMGSAMCADVSVKQQPVKAPACPSCRKLMRLRAAEPDSRYINLRDVFFECDCGTVEQLLADPA
jgi:hypothetical protein